MSAFRAHQNSRHQNSLQGTFRQAGLLLRIICYNCVFPAKGQAGLATPIYSFPAHEVAVPCFVPQMTEKLCCHISALLSTMMACFCAFFTVFMLMSGALITTFLANFCTNSAEFGSKFAFKRH